MSPRRIFACVFACLLIASFPPEAHAQTPRSFHSENFTASGTGQIVDVTKSGLNQVGIAWTISGGAVSACAVELDQSTDGVAFSGASAIVTSQTCTSNGASTLVTGTPSYVRINLTSFTVSSGSPVITVAVTGYGQQNSTGGLTVVTTLPATCTPGGANGQVLLGGTVYTCIATNVFGTSSGNFPINGKTNVLWDWQIPASESGLTIADYSGNGFTGTISGACPKGTVTRISGGGLALSGTQDCILSTSNVPSGLHAIEISYCYQDPGPAAFPTISPNNNIIPMLFGSSSTTLGFQITLGAQGQTIQRLTTNINEQTWGPNGATASASIPAGCHMLTVGLDATHDTYYMDGTQLQDFASNSPTNSFASFPLTAGSWKFVLGGSSGTGGLSTAGIGTMNVYRVRGLAVEPTSGLTGTQQGEFSAMNFAMQQEGVFFGNGIYPAQGCRVLLFGDSRYNGTLTNWASTQNMNVQGGCAIYNYTIISTYAQGAAANLTDFIPAFNPGSGPQIPIIAWGGNDVSNGIQTPDATFQSLLQIVRAMHQQGYVLPILTTIPSIKGSINGVAGQADVLRAYLNDLIRQNAVTNGYMAADPGGTVLLGALNAFSNSTYFQAVDGIHPTQLGEQILGMIVGRNVNRALALVNPRVTPNVIKVGATMPVSEPENIIACNNFLGNLAAAVLTCTYPQPVNPGDTEFIFIGEELAGSVSTVTSTSGCTWARQGGLNVWAGTNSELWMCPNSAGANAEVITVTHSQAPGGDDPALAFVVRGAPAATPFDTSAFGSGTSQSPSTSNLTTSMANELMCGIVAQAQQYGTMTPSQSGPGTSYLVQFHLLSNYPTNTATASNIFLQCAIVPLNSTVTSVNASQLNLLSLSSQWGMLSFTVKGNGVYPATWALRDTDCLTIQQQCNLDSTGGAATIQLPDASGITGQHEYLQVLGGATNIFTLAPKVGSGQTINGLATLPLPGQWNADCVSILISDSAGGDNWNCTLPKSYTVTLTAAYANATNSFTNMAGSSGPNFAFPIAANATYHLGCSLTYQAAATGGLNIEFTGPAGFSFLNYALTENIAAGAPTTSATANAYSVSQGNVITTASTNFPATISLDVVNGATAGTLQLLGKASATVALGLTVAAGSSCTITQQQ